MSEEKQLNLDKIIGFGAINWDIIAKTTHFAERGEEVKLNNIWEKPGGSAANTISWLSEYINNLSYIGAIGDDDRGKKIIEMMNKKGINTSNIIIKENSSTGTAISLLDQKNERTLYTYGGAGSSFNPKEIDEKVLKKSDLIHTSSFLSIKLLEYQEKISKMDSIFSYSPGLLCKKHSYFELKNILKNTDILFLNKKELEALIEKGSLREKITKLLEIGVGDVAVTLGEQGCICATENELIHQEPIKTKVIDTTGAGDAFAAGYLVNYLKNLKLRDKAKKGVKVASHCIQRVGGSNYGHRP